MEQKKKEQKVAQILYISIIMVLLCMAVVVGLVTAANRRKMPSNTDISNPPSSSATTPKQTSASSAQTSEVTPGRTEPSTSAAVKTEPSSDTSKKEEEADAPVPTLPEFIMPAIGNVSKNYTVDTLVYSNTMEDYRTHNGIDICAMPGEGVMAAADGIVEAVYQDPLMGYTVVISHDGDAKTVYQNLAEKIEVSVGDTVDSGEVIGAIGESAIIEIAEEPHLHFEMKVAGAYVNPLDLISVQTMTVIYDE